jgi:hypothetical protein
MDAGLASPRPVLSHPGNDRMPARKGSLGADRGGVCCTVANSLLAGKTPRSLPGQLDAFTILKSRPPLRPRLSSHAARNRDGFMRSKFGGARKALDVRATVEDAELTCE